MSWDALKKDIEVTTAVADWKKSVGDNVLIYGDSKTGKTFVAAEALKQHLTLHPTSIAYIFNTDMGFREPAIQIGLGTFSDDRIVYYQLTSIDDGIKKMQEVMKKVKREDVILWDLISYVWEASQAAFIAELGGENPIGFMKRSMTDEKKFGAFSGLQWQWVKKLDSMITDNLTKNPKCRVIAISGVKDVAMDYALNKKAKDIWVEIGKPAGRKDLMHEFANIIRIDKQQNGKRRFMIVGTRKGDIKYEWCDYTTAGDFWQKVDAALDSKTG